MDKKSEDYNSISVKWTDSPGLEYDEDILKMIFDKYGEIKG